jgi:LuxR family maltose regulon positive regulatory protein
MASDNSVLRHAITPLSFDVESKVHREHLVDEIHANVPRKLIIIAAPAGYGKTTLLADFSKHTELPVCWMRLSAVDQDLIHFSMVLSSSLQRRFRRLQGAFDFEALSQYSPEALARRFIEVIDANISETFVIALDDVHWINKSKPILNFLDRLLEELPEQITVIASGREVLEVSLARFMAEGNLIGFGPQDLALSKEEIIQLARVHSSIDIGEDGAERLQHDTRGWITGVIMSAELSGRKLDALKTSSRPMVYEYLASVVLNRQPDDLRRFVLDTSVFPVMTVEGCNYLLQREDSASMLSRIVERGLFVTATEEGPRTYEYHPQFREFLLETLQGGDAKRCKRLLISAARYLAEHDSPEFAVELYCDAGEGKSAVKLAEKRAREMYVSGRWQTLEVWARRLEEIASPALWVLLYLAAKYANQGRLDEAENILEQTKEMLDPKSPKNARAYYHILQSHIALHRGLYEAVFESVDLAQTILRPSGRRLQKAECHRLLALASSRKGDLLQAESHCEKAIDLLRKSEDKLALAYGLIDYSAIQVSLGNSSEAYAVTKQAHEILIEDGAPLPLAVSYNNLAHYSHLRGEYEEAMELYNEGLKFARQAASSPWESFILFGQADLFNDLNLALQAAELYGLGLDIAIRLDDTQKIRYGCIQTSILHRRRGGSSLAHDWLRRAINVDKTGDLTPEILIQRAALETMVKPRQAKVKLESIVNKHRELEVGVITQGLYFQSYAEFVSGDTEVSEDTLTQLLDWASANGTEQIISAELSFNDTFREFARNRISGHPSLSIILRRVETMRAVAQHYRNIGEEKELRGIRLIFNAFGEANVSSNENPLTDLKPLAREVLFYLVDHQHVDRDVLLETFWQHHPPGRQVANLHTAVYSLRRVLGRSTILHEGSVYSVNTEIPIDYDVARFERAASVAESLPIGDPRRMFALTEAINSYTGSFLSEFDSEWVIERRRDLEIQYLDLLAQHAEEALIRDQPLRALSTLRQALQIDPYGDDTNFRFLEALGRLGRRGEIVAHYQKYVNLLAADLGLDPPQPIRELYARLIRS